MCLCTLSAIQPFHDNIVITHARVIAITMIAASHRLQIMQPSISYSELYKFILYRTCTWLILTLMKHSASHYTTFCTSLTLHMQCIHYVYYAVFTKQTQFIVVTITHWHTSILPFKTSVSVNLIVGNSNSFADSRCNAQHWFTSTFSFCFSTQLFMPGSLPNVSLETTWDAWRSSSLHAGFHPSHSSKSVSVKH